MFLIMLRKGKVGKILEERKYDPSRQTLLPGMGEVVQRMTACDVNKHFG